MSEGAIRAHLAHSEVELANTRKLSAAHMRALARGLLVEANLLETQEYDGGATGAYVVAFSNLTAQLTVLREKSTELRLLRLAVAAQSGVLGHG